MIAGIIIGIGLTLIVLYVIGKSASDTIYDEWGFLSNLRGILNDNTLTEKRRIEDALEFIKDYEEDNLFI